MLDVRETNTGVVVSIKVVPNARKDEIAGLIGDRLKIRVASPPEDGKANRAVCVLIAKTLGIKKNCVSIAFGESSPLKTISIFGISILRLSDLIDSESS
ncbi:MAG: DUF167 domain-containing protein [Phycisphaerales bacterium]|jgi:hypothetical protein|nr:DUF167 domain-containing protein [Phycisphaerales bacterium]